MNTSRDSQDFLPGFGFHVLTPLYEYVNGILVGHIWRSVAKEIEKILPLDGAYLDVGCGPGNVTRWVRHYQKEFEKHFSRIVGIDIDPEMIRRAKRSARDRNLAIDYHCLSAEKLPFADHSFDVVSRTLLDHHLPEKLKPVVFAECERVLKPGGTIIDTDFSGPAHPLVKEFMARLHFKEPEVRKQLEENLSHVLGKGGAKVERLQRFYGGSICTFLYRPHSQTYETRSAA